MNLVSLTRLHGNDEWSLSAMPRRDLAERLWKVAAGTSCSKPCPSSPAPGTAAVGHRPSSPALG